MPPSAPGEPFCGGKMAMPMDMSMGGFFWGHATCIMMLWHGLPLDSPERFIRSAKFWWRSRCSARKTRHALNAK